MLARRSRGQSESVKRVVVAGMLLLTACGSSSGAPPKETAPTTTTAEQALAVDGPLLRYPHPSSASANLATLLQGKLQLDGDCLYLVVGQVGRFPIVWPAGTQWNPQSKSVVSSTGAEMGMGSSVTGRGGYFYLSDVDLLVGAVARSIAGDCLDNPWGQIVVIRNEEKAIGPS